jgi:hypothetical protein
LTQTEALIALQTTAPHDLEAIKAWLAYHGSRDQVDAIMRSIPSLPRGACWFYSPGWLGTLTMLQIRERYTYDASATPKAGEAPSRPKSIADVDLERISGQMAKALEQAKANDPAELKRQIAQLQRELQAKGRTAPAAAGVNAAEVDRRIRESLRLRDEQWTAALRVAAAGLGDLGASMEAIRIQAIRIAAGLANLRPDPAGKSAPIITGIITPPAQSPVNTKPAGGRVPRANTLNRPPASVEAGKLGKCPLAILRVLAHYPDGRSKSAVSIQSGYSVTSSTFQNGLSSLRVGGLMEGGPDCLKATPAGLELLGPVDPLPRGRDLLVYWANEVGGCPQAVLNVLWESDRLLKAEIAERAGYSITSSTFQNGLSKLRVLGLITRGEPIELTDVFRE